MLEIPANSRASMALDSIFLTHSPLFMARGERQDTMTLAMIGSRLKGLMFWKVQAMPLLTISHVFNPTISLPLNRIVPESGLRMAVINRSKVVLPAPLGPIRPSTSSRPMEKLTSVIALIPPKSLLISSISRKGCIISSSFGLFPQFAPGNLAHIGFGKLPSEFHNLGDLVVGQVLAANFDNLLFRNLAPGFTLQDNVSLDHIAHLRVGHADHTGRLDLRVLKKDLFHMPGKDRVALVLDQVALAIK